MKEIKFRAWLKEKAEMINVYHWHKGDELDRIETMYGFNHTTSFLSNEYELMQYTGLKDKNGKEIYEGDIIICETTGIFNWPHKGVVEFINGYFGINVGKEPALDNDEDQYTHFWNNQNLEIIGNIYENPELVNQKQQTY